MAQGGVWDVDGSGLQPIGDPDLASRLRAKVNAFNVEAATVAAALTLLFVVVPELF